MLLQKIKGITAVLTISVLFALFAFNLEQRFQAQNVSAKEFSYIIDAGHGIPDGGTSGKDGTTEQELNLAIALKVSEMLKNKSISHVLTRKDENSIYSEGTSIHAKKVSDIRERVAIAGKSPESPLISIHMNSYPDPDVQGIQVFYTNGNERAKKIADALQSAINAELQPNNTKVVKTISKNIYLFSHVENPSVLIECGFLSNPQDLAQLKTSEYQEKISTVIAEVLATHQ